jgi:hypothetical protein
MGPGGDVFPPGSGLPYMYRESLYVIISVFCVYCGLYTYQVPIPSKQPNATERNPKKEFPVFAVCFVIADSDQGRWIRN